MSKRSEKAIKARYEQRLSELLSEWLTVKSDQLDLLRREEIDTFLSTADGENWIHRNYQRLVDFGRKHDLSTGSRFSAQLESLNKLAEQVADELEPYRDSLSKDITKANLKLQMWRIQNKNNSD